MIDNAIRELKPWQTEGGRRRIQKAPDEWDPDKLKKKLEFLGSIDIPAELMPAYEAAKSAVEVHRRSERTEEAQTARVTQPATMTPTTPPPMSNDVELLRTLLEREED